jgi:cell division protein ZapE
VGHHRSPALFHDDAAAATWLHGTKDEARRFVTLVDALYEAGTRLVTLAAAQPEALYREGVGAFEFERTVSRLHEMAGADWLARERD